MDILNYLRYEDYYKSVDHKEVSNLILPVSFLTCDSIDEVITQTLKSLNKNEVVIFCSFVNMVCQTHSYHEFFQFSSNLLKSVGIYLPEGKVVFHRENLLYLIALSIQNHDSADSRLCWFEEEKQGQYPSDLKKICHILLLINSKIGMDSQPSNKELFLCSYILRPYPYFEGNTEVSHSFYRRWLKRYWYVYHHLLSGLSEDKKKYIEEAVKQLQESTKLSVYENYNIVSNVFSWFSKAEKFLNLPDEKIPNDPRDNPRFRSDSILSFLIDKKEFDDSDILQYVKKVALDSDQMRKLIVQKDNKTENINPFFSVINKLFNKPIIQYKDYFIILDWKFFMERFCAGFSWVLWDEKSEKKDKDLQNLRASYGHLMEEYFVDLMRRIFGNLITRPNGVGEADLIIETDTHVLVFEFTAKGFSIKSLYSKDLGDLHADIYKLFEKTGKGQDGKFHRLNEYVGNQNGKTPHKVIVPILVTEKWLGSYELIQDLGYNLDKRIADFGLSNLEKQKPLMMCLDDMETFWLHASDDNKKACDMFVECVEYWRREQYKGSSLYNFGFYIDKFYENQSNHNSVYKDFYNYPVFLSEIEQKCQSRTSTP